jgi:hypothetical protein
MKHGRGSVSVPVHPAEGLLPQPIQDRHGQRLHIVAGVGLAPAEAAVTVEEKGAGPPSRPIEAREDVPPLSSST